MQNYVQHTTEYCIYCVETQFPFLDFWNINLHKAIPNIKEINVEHYTLLKFIWCFIIFLKQHSIQNKTRCKYCLSPPLLGQARIREHVFDHIYQCFIFPLGNTIGMRRTLRSFLIYNIIFLTILNQQIRRVFTFFIRLDNLNLSLSEDCINKRGQTTMQEQQGRLRRVFPCRVEGKNDHFSIQVKNKTTVVCRQCSLSNRRTSNHLGENEELKKLLVLKSCLAYKDEE